MLLRSIGLTKEDRIKADRVLLRMKSNGEEYAPKTDGFLMRAFNANMDSANSAYNSPFINGIRTGTLAPDRYGAVNVMDAFYCYEAAKSIWDACQKSQQVDSELFALQTSLYNGYASYNSTFYDYWHVLTSKSVSPTDSFRAYAAHERSVAENEDPIYLLAALLPCYYLWYWMANKIASDSTSTPGVYFDWVDGNNHNPNSAYSIDEFIANWISRGKAWDDDKAMEIFSKSMKYESMVFNECGYFKYEKGGSE